MSQENNKTDNYFDLLRERIIKCIDMPDIQKSCTTTLLLIFAAIDSLSFITCSDNEYTNYKSSNKSKFIGFLENDMGGKYSDFKKQIYKLRCSIVHTGINTNVTLSRDDEHLEIIDGQVWINTNQFSEDFKEAMKQIEIDIQKKNGYFKNASNRLKEFNFIDIQKKASPSIGATVFK